MFSRALFLAHTTDVTDIFLNVFRFPASFSPLLSFTYSSQIVDLRTEVVRLKEAAALQAGTCA